MAEARAKRRGGKPHTFDFLGFTHYCSRARGSRRFCMKRITSRKKFTAKLRAFKEWLKTHRTLPARELMAKVVSKMQVEKSVYSTSLIAGEAPMKFFLQTCSSFLLGSFLLCLLSVAQKIIAGFPLHLTGFIIPFFYGGFVGAILGNIFFKLKNSKIALDEVYKNLEVRNEALTKSEADFRLLAEYSCDWEYWQKSDGTVVYTSPSCKAITGYMQEEFQNINLIDKMIHPEDLHLWKRHTHEVGSGGEVEPIEFRIRTKTGDTRWIQHYCRDIYNAVGEKYGVRGSNRDITKQKQLQFEVKILRGFLPICASCKKIRDSNGYWEQMEAYIRDHSEANFTHCVCPECAEKLYSELDSIKEPLVDSPDPMR